MALEWRGTRCPALVNSITRIDCERNENFSAKRKIITRLEVEGDACCYQARGTRCPAGYKFHKDFTSQKRKNVTQRK